MDIGWQRQLTASRRIRGDGLPGASVPPPVMGGQGRPEIDAERGAAVIGLALAALAGFVSAVVVLRGIPAVWASLIAPG